MRECAAVPVVCVRYAKIGEVLQGLTSRVDFPRMRQVSGQCRHAWLSCHREILGQYEALEVVLAISSRISVRGSGRCGDACRDLKPLAGTQGVLNDAGPHHLSATTFGMQAWHTYICKSSISGGSSSSTWPGFQPQSSRTSSMTGMSLPLLEMRTCLKDRQGYSATPSSCQRQHH